nr:LysR family transcriptional regulator [Martelella sp. HB161492]
MELRHWAAFVMLSEIRHFGLAAERLGISQPALSQLVRTAETHFGTRLFDRSRRRVGLTEAGQALLPDARATLEQARRAERTGELSGRGANRVLTMGYVGSAPLNPRFLALVRALSSHAEGITLSLDQSPVTDQVEAVTERRLDLGVIRSPMPAIDPSLASVNLARENMILALPATHELARAGEVARLADFAAEVFIQYRPQTSGGLNLLVRRTCEMAGFAPRVVQTVPQIATMLCLVGTGLGVALVPSSATRLALPDVVYKHLPEPVGTDLNLIYRRSDTAPAVRLAVQITRHFDKLNL